MADTFAKALINFTMDVAAGDAIRHLTDIGYGPSDIQKALTYPAPVPYIGKTMYEHLLNTNIIVLDDPAIQKPAKPYEFVLEQNEYGRTSYRRVPKNTPEDTARKPEDYICVSFGSDKYKHTQLLEDNKNSFSSKEWDYLMNIPWPRGTFWVLKDERVGSINNILDNILN